MHNPEGEACQLHMHNSEGEAYQLHTHSTNIAIRCGGGQGFDRLRGNDACDISDCDQFFSGGGHHSVYCAVGAAPPVASVVGDAVAGGDLPAPNTLYSDAASGGCCTWNQTEKADRKTGFQIMPAFG